MPSSPLSVSRCSPRTSTCAEGEGFLKPSPYSLDDPYIFQCLYFYSIIYSSLSYLPTFHLIFILLVSSKYYILEIFSSQIFSKGIFKRVYMLNWLENGNLRCMSLKNNLIFSFLCYFKLCKIFLRKGYYSQSSCGNGFFAFNIHFAWYEQNEHRKIEKW